MNDYYMFEAHIRAAEEFKAATQHEYSQFIALNQEEMKTNPLVAQQAADIQRKITKIDRKLHDLRAVQMSCVQFAIIKKELETGISCNFGSAQGDLVKVFSEGMGIQISLNKELFSEVNAPDHAESVIRAVADTFSKSYLAIKGLTPLHKPSTDSKRATPSKGEKS
jgi:hypothetical protein